MPVLATGCVAGVPAARQPSPALEAELLAAGPAAADVDVLALDDDMRQFIATHVDLTASPNRRLRQLLEAVAADGRLQVEYDEVTLTAAETFHRRRANCLSYTNMFIALARAARVAVRFQEVDIPPDWSRSGDTLVLNRHVDALVDTSDGRDRVVDFNIADFRTAYDHRPIADARAFAHYHSNLGVERMQAGDHAAALRHYRSAIAHDRRFAPAWVNLGTLYLRAGQQERAEAAWQQALAISPGESVALSNLERLYRQRGENRLADELRARIERHRLQNPYYRYFLAQQAYAARDYGVAIDHLRFAIARKENEDRFFALLGMSYLQQGDARAAQRWMARAAEVAGDEDLQRSYHSKLELLGRAGSG